MKIITRALLMAAGVGGVFQTIFQLINAGTLIGQYSAGGDPTQMTPITGIVGSLLCIFSLIMDVGAGFLYAHFGRREAVVSVGSGALGGALAGLAARFVSSLVGSCISVLLIPLFQNRAAADLPSELAGPAADLGTAGGMVGIFFVVCLYLVAGGIFGAVGGAIGQATVGQGQKPALA
jgi:hypothetical protein